MKATGNTILITGGGSGIGEALAHRFHDLGNTVIIAGRRKDVLERAAAGRENMHAMTFDVENRESIADFAARLLDAFPLTNVLLNNAGIMRTEELDRWRDLTDAEATIATNLLGPIRLTNALVEHLSVQADAAIINVTSGLAFVPMFATPTYNATKAAIHSYTLSLREALKGKIEVVELVPPAVQTTIMPGQASRPEFMPLEEFVDEAMTLLVQRPTPPEILVKRVEFQRFAEAEGRFDQAFGVLNGRAAKLRGN